MRSATAGDEAVAGTHTFGHRSPTDAASASRDLVYRNQTTTDWIEPEPPTLRIADLTKMPGTTAFS